MTQLITPAILCALAVIAIEIVRRKQIVGDRAPAIANIIPGVSTDGSVLHARIGDVEFAEVRLRSALAILADRSGSNLDADWDALREIGVSSEDPVTLQLHDPFLEDALQAICNQLKPNEGHTVGLARNPAGILLLGSADRDHQSVTTLPRLYDVDDLLGPAAASTPSPSEQLQNGDARLPQATRPELRRLTLALSPFVTQGQVSALGRRLIVRGYVAAHRCMEGTLAHLRHPIRITGKTELPAFPALPPVPDFQCPCGTPASMALEMWQRAGSGRAVVELGANDEQFLAGTVNFGTTDATLEQIANQLIAECHWPFIVVGAGEEDDRVHLRRFRVESSPRAYDVSGILAKPAGWIGRAKYYLHPNQRVTNEEVLLDVVNAGVNRGDRRWDSAEPETAGFWNGLLLIQDAPEVHARILRFLLHLQRTGRPDDPPPKR